MAQRRQYRTKGGGRQRRISVRAIRRNPPDLRKLSRALIQLALADAATEAAAQAQPDEQPADAAAPKQEQPHD